MKVGFYFRENQSDPELEGTVYGYVVAEVADGKKNKSCGFSTKIKVLYADYLKGAHLAKTRKVEIEVEALYTYLCGALNTTPSAEQVKDEYLRRKKPMSQKPTPKAPSPLVADILAEYIAKATIRESTRRIYNSLAGTILNILGQNCTASELNAELVRHLYDTLSKPETNGRATNAVVLIKSAFKKCKVENLALEHFEHDKYRQKGLVFLEQTELEAFWQHSQELTGLARQIADYFVFMCDTGISVCDFKLIKPSDVVEHKERLYLTGKRIKTNKDFFVELSSRAEKIGTAYQWSFAIPVHLVTFRYYISDIMKALGIEKRITPHKARHTKAMQILDDTGDPMFAAATLGNTPKMIENHYGKLRLSGYARIADKYRKK
jgi:integrase